MKTDLALWQAINAYDVDAADVALPFSRRLARDNGWSAEFTRRAIDEYKRFIYLACVSGRTVTPSEEVDGVWHMHLIYTRDYWDRFCGEILRRPIHHSPTQGGQGEADRHRRCYRQTLELYRTEFGTEPPEAMWPNETIRFGPDFTRVIDSRTHLILPKRYAFPSVSGAAMLALAACSPAKVWHDVGLGIFVLVIAVFVISGLVSGAKRPKGKGDGSGSGCGGGCGSGCGGGCGGD